MFSMFGEASWFMSEMHADATDSGESMCMADHRDLDHRAAVVLSSSRKAVTSLLTAYLLAAYGLPFASHGERH